MASTVGDGFAVEVAQLLTVDAAGTTVRPVFFMRMAAMSTPSPMVAVMALMPYLWKMEIDYMSSIGGKRSK